MPSSCGPARAADGARMPVPDAATRARIAYLPPMSGLVDREFVKQQGEIDYLVGQGQTAHVLRNMCYNLLHGEAGEEKWDAVVRSLLDLYGVELLRPELGDARSEISMSYRERGTSELDLSSAGRGLQQTLLLLTFLWGNQGSIILLDEPDAHLEILRQRQIFALLTR